MTLTSADISTLYTENAQPILRFLMRRTLDAQLAVDLLSETFAVAFEQRGRFRGDLAVQGESWLFGIANNLLNNYFRSGQIERRALERLGVSPTVLPEDQYERIEQLAGSAQLRASVAQALGEISEDQRRALQLRVVEEREYSDIAGELGVSEQVARSRVSRALGSMRDVLGDAMPNEVIENA